MVALILEIDDGTACDACKDNCPGYKAHNWRKICQSCKCPREAHAIFHEQPTSTRERLGLKPNVLISEIDARQLGFAWIPPGIMTSAKILRFFERMPAEMVPKVGTVGEQYRDRQIIYQLPKQDLSSDYCKYVEPQCRASYEDFVAARNEIALDVGYVKEVNQSIHCGKCRVTFPHGDLAVVAPKFGDHIMWHPECFVCSFCDEMLIDLTYCAHDGKLYCERHYAELLKPRCSACDEKYLVTTQTDHKAEISVAVDQDFDVTYSTTEQNTFLNEVEDHQISYESNTTKYIGEHISSNQKFELTNDIIRIDSSNINGLNSKQVEIEGKFGGPPEIGSLALDKQNSLRLTVNHLENAQPDTRRSHMNANGDLAKHQKDIIEVVIESQYEPELNSEIEASPRKMSPKKYKNISMDVTAFTSSADPFKNTSINVPYLESNQRHNKVNPHKLSDFSDVSPKLSKACKIKSKISPLQPSLHGNQIIPNNTERQGNSNELEGLSDFYDFNAMLNGAAYGYNGTFEPTQLQWRSTDFLHGHSKNNPSANETTIKQKSLTDSRFSPVDERKHTYAKQVSVADFSDYTDYFDDLREKAKHFQRSRSQSRSIGSSFESQLDHREWDIHQSEPVKPTRGFGSLSSRELTPEPYLNSKIFMKSRTISTDDKMLDFLEGDEYHHYRRHSLFQQHQPDMFSHDDYDDSTVAEARTSAQPGYLVLTVETPQTLHRSVSEICTRSIDHFLESQSQDSCNTFCQSHCDLEKN